MAAKISMFFCFFLLVLITMPTSSSSRMMLGVGVGVEVGLGTKSCPAEDCSGLGACPPGSPDPCPQLECPNGVRQMCCDCDHCCP
ncbi:hypothetical protein MKW98_011517 [Papaver atlanticum]|uniref:Uncharacterized protein n=1 Tax=Papaver atlanticum TaxID=357466 RepID=A0AAD4RYB5_9MAGN|nr:hypothetical protein MKW98_011517 [Papaver atlanticum]